MLRTACILLFALISTKGASQPTSCETDTHNPHLLEKSRVLKSDQQDSIYIHLFVSYDLYNTLNLSESEITNYVDGLIHQIDEIYQLDNISIGLAELTIWSEPDPYDLADLSRALASFSSNHHGSHSGHLAHLLTHTSDYIGGKAFLRGLCDSAKSFGVSSVYGVVNDSWEYSWDVHILAHEIGHNLGSQHTHDCVWGPEGDTAIDGCSNNLGCGEAPIPSEGGTIMSYCQGHVEGIDFSLGLSNEPASRIKNYISECLAQEGEECEKALTILDNGEIEIADISSGSGASRADASHAKWYMFTPEENGLLDIQSCHQGVDTRLRISIGSCDSLLVIYESDDSCMSGDGFNYAAEVVGLEVLAQQKIYIEWDDRWSQEGFTWSINYTPVLSTCNDEESIPNVIDTSLSYRSMNEIDYHGYLLYTANLSVSSSQNIKLSDGFTVEAGADFEVNIQDCIDN